MVAGDTLWAIASEFGITVEEIKRANDLQGDRIEIGQQLIIPSDSPAIANNTQPSRSARTKTRRPRHAPAHTAPETQPMTLSRPAPKPCLDGPDLNAIGDEAEMIASVGLSMPQVKASMNNALPYVGNCISAGGWPTGKIDLEITVECNGRVQSVSVLRRNGVSVEIAQCAQTTLQNASFPAHDMPDGFTFQYPMTFSP